MPKLPIIFLQVHCTAAKQMDGEGRAIYYFILLLLRDAGHGPGHGPHGHGHAGGLAQVASAIRGSGRVGGFAINPQTLIFFVFPTANCCGCCSGTSTPSPWLAAGVTPATPAPGTPPLRHLSPLAEDYRRHNPRCGLSGIIN